MGKLTGYTIVVLANGRTEYDQKKYGHMCKDQCEVKIVNERNFDYCRGLDVDNIILIGDVDTANRDKFATLIRE